MQSSAKAVVVFLLGSASVFVAGGLLSGAKALGVPFAPSPWPMGLLIGGMAMVTSLLLPGSPMAFSVGAFAVFLVWGVCCGSAACLAVNVGMGVLVFLPSLTGEGLGVVIRASRRRRASKPPD